jgi:DNA invertase Pin-like site-specific DNA recombinase
VSTDRQTTDTQRGDVLALVKARGWEPVVFEEVESAAKVRPVLAKVLELARVGEVGAVCVWALDRLHRSMPLCVSTVLELDRVRCQVVSVREPWLDTAGPVRGLLVAIFGWVAEQERERLRDRTRAGVARARAEGKQIGRPKLSPAALSLAVELVRLGSSHATAADRAGVSVSSLRAHLAAAKRGGVQ